MPRKQATSAATAASRTRAPQTHSKAAGRRTPTRESRRASETVVREPGKPFHPVISSELVCIAMGELNERDELGSGNVTYLAGLFERDPLFLLEYDTLIKNMDEAENHLAMAFYVRLFAARMFRSAFIVAYYAGRATALPGGAL